MGKSYQGIHGNYQGKVGNVVAREKDGRTILSIYVRHPQNPRTAKQTAVRDKFRVLSQFCSCFEGWAKIMCKGLYEYGNYYSNLIKLNPFTDVVGGVAPGYEILLNKVRMSKGMVSLGEEMTASAEAEVISVLWNDNTDGEDALANDECCIVVYNSVKDKAVYVTTGAGTRSQRQATITCPSAWSGDSVDVWGCFRRNDGSAVGDSVYLGNMSL